MLRLHPQTNSEDLPCLHHSINPKPTHSLHRLEQELSYGVGIFIHISACDSPTSSQLFGEDEDATGELDNAEKEGENAQEIAALRKEATAFKAVRDALRSKSSTNAAQLVFQKVASCFSVPNGDANLLCRSSTQTSRTF